MKIHNENGLSGIWAKFSSNLHSSIKFKSLNLTWVLSWSSSWYSFIIIYVKRRNRTSYKNTIINELVKMENNIQSLLDIFYSIKRSCSEEYIYWFYNLQDIESKIHRTSIRVFNSITIYSFINWNIQFIYFFILFPSSELSLWFWNTKLLILIHNNQSHLFKILNFL